MRILWFTNSPSRAITHLTGAFNVGTSWIEAMEGRVSALPDVQLGLAFYWQVDEPGHFDLEGTRYYTLPRKGKSKVSRLLARMRHQIEDGADVPHYLRVIEDFQPDLIMFFGSESPYGLVQAHTDVPCVVWIQGILSTITPVWYRNISESEVRKYSSWKDRLNYTGFADDLITMEKMAARERKILAATRHIIGRTTWDRRVAGILAPEARYYSCNDLIRQDFLEAPYVAHPEPEVPSLLTIVRGNIYKGVETIFEIMQLLKPRLSGKIRWRIAGLSETDRLSQILIKRYGQSPESLNISLMGSVNAAQLVDLLKETDIFVHPSHIDNSPNSVCEAMLLGKPVVSTYAGGIPDLLKSGKEGLLVQDGDAYAMAAAILEMLEDWDWALDMGKAGRARALLRHDPDQNIEALMDIYQQVLAAEGKVPVAAMGVN